MSYCDVSDIQSEFKQISFSEDDASVTASSVEEFITQADAEIDSIISTRYETPVTSSNAGASALALLKQCSVWLVSRRVKDILELKNVRTEVDQDIKTDTRAMALSILKRIANGESNLVGASLATGEAGVSSGVVANNVARVFNKDQEQW